VLDRRTRHYFILINFDFLQCTSFLVSNQFSPLHFLFLKPVHHIKAYITIAYTVHLRPETHNKLLLRWKRFRISSD